jgi:modification methylase
MPRASARPTSQHPARAASGPVPLDRILQGDSLDVLPRLPPACVDLVFADPPYNLQLSQELWRPNQTRVAGVEEAWDRFDSFSDYDGFTRAWLSACRRVLKPTGSLWVIGTYHNIYRVGALLQDLGYWILNDIVWIKTNPMPNFRGVRFTNAHETLIWAATSRDAKYVFDHHAMRALNDDLQMRSDWTLPVCGGQERIRTDGKKAHPTQKPEALLTRVLLASSRPGDVVLDPFFGTGTTGVVARRLRRHWIGIEKEEAYISIARSRLAAVKPVDGDPDLWSPSDGRRIAPRISLGDLVARGWLRVGQRVFFRQDPKQAARIRADGLLSMDGQVGSIHQTGRRLSGGSPCNGWEHWYFREGRGGLRPISELRRRLQSEALR